uniref:Probable purine permease n=1 Tax=Opuntia streptacantha TaxID=393608 RepID=A0A7C9AV14_OPUST
MTGLLSLLKLTHNQWWMLVVLSIFFLIVGRTSAVLLVRFYYAEGGSSMCVATVVQTAGFPILCIPLILTPPTAKSSDTPDPVPKKLIILNYLCFGVLLAGINLLHAVGLLYLSASTYSLIGSTQLFFNAMFALAINSQKITPIILNSLIILTFSAALVAADQVPDERAGVTKVEYAIGVLCTLSASAVYALWLCLMQLVFQKVFNAKTFTAVMKMQLYTSLVAAAVSTIGLFATGQWRNLGGEMRNFNTGPASYIMTLVWTAISWQVCSVSVVSLVFLVSSLFSNAIVIVALAVAPIASLIVFHDRLSVVKGIAILQALWGFSTYLYQNYRDDCRVRSQIRMQKQMQTKKQAPALAAAPAQTQTQTQTLKVALTQTDVGETSQDSHCIVPIEQASQ